MVYSRMVEASWEYRGLVLVLMYFTPKKADGWHEIIKILENADIVIV